jgi:3'-phosphoadenosine 5'-phosphosulfate sulfotransferase (PAPS reductase)/FAD synthetase
MRVVFYSGGVGSWAAAKRVAEKHGTAGLVLLFTDTKTEHPDTYRFLRESAANVGGRLVEVADGRDIWQVFKDERMLGNSRIDPCSKILKRQTADRWLRENCAPADTTLYFGIDWTEMHRLERIRERRKPWACEAPMCEAPYLTKREVHEWAAREGLRKQVLYELGASHANCGGCCVKAGVGHFSWALKAIPETYREWERREQEMRDMLGRDVTILRESRDGERVRLTLRDLRERLESGGTCDLLDLGGCGCFTDD